MKLSARMAGIAVVVFLVLGLAVAAARAALDAAPGGGAAAQGVLSGKVASIDLEANLVKIKTGLIGQKEVLIKDSTKISDGTKSMELGDLKPGDEVTLSYEEADGKPVASSLRVTSGAASSEESPPATRPQ